MSGAVRRLGSPRRIAELIRAQVHAEQRITCSVGVASTKFVAKLASARCKPDGLLVVPADQVVEYLHPLPVGALWGVGEKTAEQLHRLGLRTVGEIAHTPQLTLRRALGQTVGAHLYDLAWGRDPRRVVAEQVEKSTGAEETFGVDVDDPEIVLRELLRLSERTARRLRSSGTSGTDRRAQGAVRRLHHDHEVAGRFASRPTWPATSTAASRQLYDALHLERARIRLVGVRVEGLVDSGGQHRQLLLDERPQGWREAEQATDRAVARFGSHSVRPASLLDAARVRHPDGRSPGDEESRRSSWCPAAVTPDGLALAVFRRTWAILVDDRASRM